MTKSMSSNSITTLYKTQDTEILNWNILPTIVTEDTTQHEPCEMWTLFHNYLENDFISVSIEVLSSISFFDVMF